MVFLTVGRLRQQKLRRMENSLKSEGEENTKEKTRAQFWNAAIFQMPTKRTGVSWLHHQRKNLTKAGLQVKAWWGAQVLGTTSKAQSTDHDQLFLTSTFPLQPLFFIIAVLADSHGYILALFPKHSGVLSTTWQY